MEFTPERKQTLDRILARYPVRRSALVPALHLLQEQEGFVSDEGMAHLASLLGLTTAQVHDTASFYTMFRFAPEGKTQIEVCTNLSCALNGADALVERACRRLGIEEGGSSADGRFTVRRVECLAGCGGGPAAQVDGRWVENLGEQDLDRVLSGELGHRPFRWPQSPGEPILLKRAFGERPASLDEYRKDGGYGRLKELLSMPREQIVDLVKKSNLRGRGGAGFPTGMKWGFLPKNDKPRYLCVNADEGEPGTFKDRLLLEKDPHQLIEGCILAAYAINCTTCYIYVRGEFHEAMRAVDAALAECYAAGLLGQDILGTGVGLDIYTHPGAGSYECGEETALIESLEGKRGQPRLKPPFPAVSGLYDCPTIVNNVETLACVPLVLTRGPEWFAAYGTEKNGGPKLYCISGQVVRPGVYEAPMGKITLRQLIFDQGYGQGLRPGRRLRAVVPGGSSTPVFTADEIDVAMDFDSIAKAGSMLGSAGTIAMDDSTCMVWMALRLTHFYKHESCGKCTPCREGTGWMLRLLRSIEAGQASEKDLDLLLTVCDSIGGKTLCPFGDAAIAPPQSTLGKFREEYEYHVREKRCWREVATTFEEAKSKPSRSTVAVG